VVADRPLHLRDRNGDVAAILPGVPIGKVKIFVFARSGLFSGMAGMMMVARTYGRNPTIADRLLLRSIAAVVIAGTAITGRFHGLARTILGALTIGVLRISIAVVGLDPAYEPIAYGLFIVVAVALSIDRSHEPIRFLKLPAPRSVQRSGGNCAGAAAAVSDCARCATHLDVVQSGTVLLCSARVH
jgi:ABC-type uncharacterized transport system permease subunit